MPALHMYTGLNLLTLLLLLLGEWEHAVGLEC